MEGGKGRGSWVTELLWSACKDDCVCTQDDRAGARLIRRMRCDWEESSVLERRGEEGRGEDGIVHLLMRVTVPCWTGRDCTGLNWTALDCTGTEQE